ncbi:MAG: crossover junction endodeoxyribonuclease RuvC [Nitriliruptorales bacterium]|nr:crossover junction endodeoxyribonuclease RuvC [Nitriliruptorales bacterium]
MEVVLGIDPGLTRCGVAIVAGSRDPQLRHAGVIRTSSDDPIEARLLALDDALRDLIAVHEPTVAAAERVVFNANARTAMPTGQAAGVAMLAAARAGLRVHQYTATAVKLAVAGHGGADKDAVGRMVVAQLGLSAVPRPADAADAVAVALCHLARAVIPGAGPSGSWEDVVVDRGLVVKGGTGGGLR